MAARELTRRDFVRMSVASAFGVASCPWLPRLAAAAGKKPAKACIVLWMSGGPSQTDTWDLKPGHKNGGPFKETATAVPGLRFSEHLTKLAAAAKELGIVRSMTTKEGEHGRATQLLHTGQLPSEAVAYPALGSMLAKEIGDPEHDLPSYITISTGGPATERQHRRRVPRPAVSPRWPSPGSATTPTPAPTCPSTTSSPRRPVAATRPGDAPATAGRPPGRFREAQRQRRDPRAHAASYRKAQQMIDTEARGGFRLDEEPAKLRDAYGRNRFGQGCLLARRLVERGVSFVEVTLDGWDTHHRTTSTQVKTLSETLDPAFATLLSDLKDRGMLANTLVVWMGEFGRTPLINNARPRPLPGRLVHGAGRGRGEGRSGRREHREGRHVGDRDGRSASPTSSPRSSRRSASTRPRRTTPGTDAPSPSSRAALPLRSW